MVSFVVYLVLFVIYVLVVVLTPDRSPSEQDTQPSGEDRFTRLATLLFLCWWIAFLLPMFTSPWEAMPLWPSVGVGVFLFALGSVVRKVAVQTLGRLFTYQLCIREEHRIVQEGIYRWIRHPSYTGTLLEALGMLVAARSLYGLCLFAVAASWLFALRIRREEQMMLDQFGDDYRDYMKRTYRFIPWVF